MKVIIIVLFVLNFMLLGLVLHLQNKPPEKYLFMPTTETGIGYTRCLDGYFKLIKMPGDINEIIGFEFIGESTDHSNYINNEEEPHVK